MLALYVFTQTWLAQRLKDVKDRDTGASAVEYGLLVGLIAVAIIAALTLLGPKLAALFDGVTGKLPAPAAPAA